jgi:Antitoxin VbhA
MAVEFNIESRWPELFVSLDQAGRTVVVNAFASSWHEGWVPNREDVENLTDFTRGAIDEADYNRRAAGAVARHQGHAIAS